MAESQVQSPQTEGLTLEGNELSNLLNKEFKPKTDEAKGAVEQAVRTLAEQALSQTKLLVSGLEVDADRMRANLDLTRGMIVSEAVMMGLGPHLGRQRAHDLVYDICRKVSATGVPLVELLAQNAEISKHLTRAELDKMCDPAGYLGLAGEMVDKVLAREGRKVG